MARKKLGEMLLDVGLIDPDGLRAALGEQRRWGHALGRTLVDMRLISEPQLVEVLAQQLLVPTVDLERLKISANVLAQVSAELAQRHQLIPFAQALKFLDVAMADPTNAGIIDELRIRTQLNIRPHLAGPRTIERAIAKHYLGTTIDVGSPDLGPGAGDSIRPMLTGQGAAQPASAPEIRDLEIEALQARLSQLEALVERDEQVLRKLFTLLIDKGIATRDDILERLGE